MLKSADRIVLVPSWTHQRTLPCRGSNVSRPLLAPAQHIPQGDGGGGADGARARPRHALLDHKTAPLVQLHDQVEAFTRGRRLMVHSHVVVDPRVEEPALHVGGDLAGLSVGLRLRHVRRQV